MLAASLLDNTAQRAKNVVAHVLNLNVALDLQKIHASEMNVSKLLYILAQETGEDEQGACGLTCLSGDETLEKARSLCKQCGRSSQCPPR